MSRLSVEEIDLWRRAMRDVAPLRARAGFASPVPHRGHPGCGSVDAGETTTVPARPAVPEPRVRRSEPPLDRFAGVDRRTAERVRRGRYPIEARLDLHGFTQEEAHRALARFVAASREAGLRCVLVITGHGRFTGGVLKAAVPRWLAELDLRRHVLAIAPAQQRDGGSGALYLLLRRAAR